MTDTWSSDYEPEPEAHERDQTVPRSPADFLRAQLSVTETKARRVRGAEVLPAPEVRQMVGQAAGALEALEDRSLQVAEQAGRIRELEEQLTEARGDTDPDQLRLWRARYMAEAQEQAEGLYAAAQERSRAIVGDARRRGEALMLEAQRRAARNLQAMPGGMPAPPEMPTDRIEAAVIQARYLDAMTAWLGEQRHALRAHLDDADRDLAEARQLSGS